MNEQKLLGMLGMAARAGCVESGGDACREAIRQRKAYLLLIGADLSPGQRERLQRLCGEENVPQVVCTREDQLGRAIGRPGRMVVAITQKGFAERAMSLSKAGVAD